MFTHKNGKRISDILLGCFFLAIALNLLDVFLLIAGVYALHPYIAGWGSCIPLLFGPFIFFYTKSVLNRDFIFSAGLWSHFLPFGVVFLAAEFYMIGQPRAAEERLLSDILQHHLPKSITVASTLIFIQFLCYVMASLKLVGTYKKAAAQHLSANRQMDVSWLSSSIFFFLLVITIAIINGLLVQTALGTFYLVGFNIIIFALLVFVIGVLLKALQRPYFFSFSEPDGFSAKSTPGSEKIEKERIAQEVLKYMQSSKPYLEPELTLEQLASRLSLKPRILSQSINEILGQNFYDFVNRFRIEEALRLLTNPKDKKITVLEVLYEVGFNSKSSFNTLFKKYTGLTPTAFRKKQTG
jgi:AraC-like DNA-binding protein